MLVSDWMTKNVITVRPDNSLLDCKKIYKEHRINRLPVVDGDGKLVGIISFTDFKSFTPELPTHLELLEILDVLAETPVSRVMTKNPRAISPRHFIEDAAQVMLREHVACLPVIDRERHVIGLVTGKTVFRALLTITGAIRPSEELGFDIPNSPGTLKSIMTLLRELPVQVVSVLSSLTDNDMRMVKIRLRMDDPDDEAAKDGIIARLRDYPGIRYWTRDGKTILRAGEA